jgi:hypothetical protein
MSTEEEEYLLGKINSALTQEWHLVTPEYLKELKQRKEEYQKQKNKNI